MNTNAEYLARMETQMKKWDADVDALAARGEKVSADARVAYHQRIKELRANREAAQRTFLQIRTATESAGAQMRAGMELTWKAMQKALERVTADHKSATR